jgi:hypothetical protein
VGFARPLDQLIPKDTKPQDQQAVLERQIKRLTATVATALYEANLSPVIKWEAAGASFDREGPNPSKTYESDVLVNYFSLTARDDKGRVFEALMTLIDHAIGFYEMAEASAKRRRWNPIAWAGFVLSVPIRVLMFAGVISPLRGSDDKLLNVLLTIGQVAWTALLAVGTWLIANAASNHWPERLFRWLGDLQ